MDSSAEPTGQKRKGQSENVVVAVNAVRERSRVLPSEPFCLSPARKDVDASAHAFTGWSAWRREAAAVTPISKPQPSEHYHTSSAPVHRDPLGRRVAGGIAKRYNPAVTLNKDPGTRYRFLLGGWETYTRRKERRKVLLLYHDGLLRRLLGDG